MRCVICGLVSSTLTTNAASETTTSVVTTNRNLSFIISMLASIIFRLENNVYVMSRSFFKVYHP